MECNKEEAMRAKEIAEQKMQNNDFEGALRVAVKAQALYPELENINQLLMVCNVHCAAQTRISGTEKDLYGILQLEKFADDTAIKKQYRKLALALHPDKNKLPGAEAAFKLIGEANIVLLDPAKRAPYDNKCRVWVRTAQAKPPHKASQNPPASKQFGNIPNGFGPQFSNLNIHQMKTNSSVVQETFWTYCPSCTTKYQYHRRFVNCPLRCQKCAKPFIAHDLGAEGVPVGFNCSQPAAQGAAPRSYTNQPVFPAPHMGAQGNAWVRSVSGTGGGSTTGVDRKVYTNEKDDKNLNAAPGRKGTSRADAGKPRKTGELRTKGRKRGRKNVLESSESCDDSNSDDTDEVVEQNGEPGANGFHETRRSSRHRRNVSYKDNKSDDDDDFENPPKKPHKSNASLDDVLKKEAFGKVESETCGTDSRSAADKVEIVDDSESDVHSDDNTDIEPKIYDCPDAEFNDFTKDEQTCFAVDQIWALYDTLDGMPRFYAQIRKVFKPQFKLRITWLEADPENQAEVDWVEQDLPFGCGRYSRGNTEDNSDSLAFSHQMQCAKGKGRGSFLIYPRKGEIWALFHDWDIRWSMGPGTDRKYRYEIVEVMSDFVEDNGIRVVYLHKVKGFVSLFHRINASETDSLLIPHTELLRFSHRIPSCKMTGTEKEGVPEGSYELDPAALPTNPSDLIPREDNR